MPEFDSTLEYRDVPSFPGYKVGNDGSVWSCLRKGWRRLKPTQAGRYPFVHLSLRGKHSKRYCHTLVLEAFVGPCPPGMEACHFPDRNSRNNHIGNLRWDTHQSNFADSVVHGTAIRGERHGNAKLREDEVRNIRDLAEAGMRQSDIARMYGVRPGRIWEIVRRKRWRSMA